MDKTRRNERMAVLTKELTSAPNRIFTLSHFCELLGVAKSTLSEDVELLRETFERFGLGRLETIVGSAGGVCYRPVVNQGDSARFVTKLCERLRDPARLLPGGFFYLADILSDPQVIRPMGAIIADAYREERPDFVLTMETKGIPVAFVTADALGVPLVIARRSGKAYEGSAVNINYVSGSAGSIATMSLSRRAVREGQRALIVDDFLKGGGTARGMVELMAEFGVSVVGMAFVMETRYPERKRIQGHRSLLVMDVDEDAPDTPRIDPAAWLLAAEGA